MEKNSQISLSKICGLLSEMAVVLISNGANSARTKRNIARVSDAYGFRIDPFFSHSAIVLTVEEKISGRKKTIVKSIAHYAVNYSIITEISILTWQIFKVRPSLQHIESRMYEIVAAAQYPEWLKILMIAAATGALSQMFDGGSVDFLISFIAAVAGYLARKFLINHSYNPYMAWLFAAFVSASAVNISRKFGLENYQGALTACVLWLIPGVPLINGFLDILENYIVSGWARVSMGIMMIFMIAIGFCLSLFIFGYGYGL